jgi:hypothetical protein
VTALRLDYEAREAFVEFHRRDEQFAALVCHRRAGKTVACINDLVDASLRCEKKNPRFAYIAPYYRQAKTVAWQYLKDAVRPLRGAGIEVRINEGELYVEFPTGARVSLYGADNYDAMRGLYFDGVVLDEFADFSPLAWREVIYPALTDRNGWAVFIGTPKGRNAFWQVYDNATRDPRWYSMMLKASDSGLVSEEALDIARQQMTPEQYDQEWECSFDAAITGAYYAKQITEIQGLGHLCEVPHDPNVPTYTAWDLGIGDSTSIWCWQAVGSEIHVIDFYENNGFALDHYFNWCDTRAYTIDKHFLPHDAKARELIAGRSRVETFLNAGYEVQIVQSHKVDDGINAARVLLGQCFFDIIKCELGLEALRQYRADYDEKRDVLKTTPLHDWTSHAADAFRYLAVGYREIKPDSRAEKGKTLQTGIPLNELWSLGSTRQDRRI